MLAIHSTTFTTDLHYRPRLLPIPATCSSRSSRDTFVSLLVEPNLRGDLWPGYRYGQESDLARSLAGVGNSPGICVNVLLADVTMI